MFVDQFTDDVTALYTAHHVPIPHTNHVIPAGTVVPVLEREPGRFYVMFNRTRWYLDNDQLGSFLPVTRQEERERTPTLPALTAEQRRRQLVTTVVFDDEISIDQLTEAIETLRDDAGFIDAATVDAVDERFVDLLVAFDSACESGRRRFAEKVGLLDAFEARLVDTVDFEIRVPGVRLDRSSRDDVARRLRVAVGHVLENDDAVHAFDAVIVEHDDAS